MNTLAPEKKENLMISELRTDAAPEAFGDKIDIRTLGLKEEGVGENFSIL